MKLLKKLLIGGVSLFFIIFFLLAYLSVQDPFFQKIPFDADIWREGNERVRGEMVDDLRNKGILIGKSRQEVIALLGASENSGDGLSYTVDIGYRFGFSPWNYQFLIIFDNNLVTRTSLHD